MNRTKGLFVPATVPTECGPHGNPCGSCGTAGRGSCGTPTDRSPRSSPSSRREPRGSSPRWGLPGRCLLKILSRTNPSTTRSRCRAYRKDPTDWVSSSQPCERIPRQHSLRCRGTTHTRPTAFHYPQMKTLLLCLLDKHTPTPLQSEGDTLRLLSAFQPCVLSPSVSHIHCHFFGPPHPKGEVISKWPCCSSRRPRRACGFVDRLEFRRNALMTNK